MRTPHGLPSASKLQLARACPASQVLPVVDSEWASGEAGREKHAALAWRIGGAEYCPDEISESAQAWLDSLDDETIASLLGSQPEAAFAYDVATGRARHLGNRLERDYPALAATEFPGSLDYVRVGVDSVMVVDLKTGLGDVPHPSRNMQLRFGALAAARHYGATRARVGILHASDGRVPWWSWATFETADLDAVNAELAALAERILDARYDVERGLTPPLRVGEHCTHCPARHGCPARVAMAKRLAGEPERVVLDLQALLTPETAALALARWQAATKAMQEVGSTLYAYASENPIALGDGRVWGPRESTREVIDAEKAWPVLVAEYGVDVARAAMTLSTSRAGVSRAMSALRESVRGAAERPQGVPEGKVTLKGLNEEALRALREAGAVTTRTTKTFETYSVAADGAEQPALPAEESIN